MSETTKFLLRKITGDTVAQSEQEVLDWFMRGQCKGGDFLYSFQGKIWHRVGDLPSIEKMSTNKPSIALERKLVYFLPIASGQVPMGPFSLKEIQIRIQSRELADSTWVFIEGDKEWRQVRQVKALKDMLPPLPQDHPQVPVAAETKASTEADLVVDGLTPSIGTASQMIQVPQEFSPTPEDPSIKLDMSQADAAPVPHIEQEEQTKAVSALGLSREMAPMPEMKKAPPKPAAPPPSMAPAAASAPTPHVEKEAGSYDGITAEIPMDPIWLVKPNNSEMVSGPFRFLEVIQFLQEGKVTKNDKISKIGSKSFIRIAQQYEFNVKYSVETVVEHGVEKQKIFIRRRHPRVPYLASVQVVGKMGLVAGTCVNISAGGILMEAPKAEFQLGDIVELKILPALIKTPIVCKALVIGKVPKIPPGYALKFEDLKQNNKEEIEYFVQEALKKEQMKT